MTDKFKKITAWLGNLKTLFGKIIFWFKNIFPANKIFFNKKHLAFWQQKDLDKKLVFSIRGARIPSSQQLKMLPSVLSNKERKIVKSLIAVIILSLIVWGWHIYATNLKLVPANGGSYTEGLIGCPKYINPIISQTNDVDRDLSALIFSGLIKYDSNQKIINDLAEKYEISPDQKSYTFTLKNNLFWQDKEPLTADDVVFTINSIKNRDFNSPLFTSFNGVTVEKIDDKTVKFTLAEPYGPFINLLNFGILPKHIWEDVEPANAGLADYNLSSPIGSGPFRAKSYSRDKSGKIKSYTLVRNEEFYGQKPYLDKITFVFFDSQEEAFDGLKNKDVDGLSFLSAEQKNQLTNKASLNFYDLKIPEYSALFINQKNDMLKAKAFRQALAYGLDRTEIIKQALGDNGRLINGPILPGFIGYKEDLKNYEFNADKARSLIESLGWRKEKPEDQFYKKTEKKETKELTVNLTVINKELNLKIAELIKKYWEAIGIKINILPLDVSQIQEKIFTNHDYEILLYRESLGLDADPYAFWHSSQISGRGLNLSQFANKEIDKVLEEARAITDTQARRDKYVYFQNIMTEEMPAIFLDQPIYYYAIDKKIKGVKLDNLYIANSSDRFTDIDNWYIKTKKKLELGSAGN